MVSTHDEIGQLINKLSQIQNDLQRIKSTNQGHMAQFQRINQEVKQVKTSYGTWPRGDPGPFLATLEKIKAVTEEALRQEGITP